jgi:hypothetical protein
MVLITRVGRLVMWISFMLFHVIIFVVAFFWLWITETTPAQLIAQTKATLHLLLDPTTGAVLRYLGVSSLVAVAVAYVWLWRKIYSRLVTPFIFRPVNDYLRQGQ